MIVRGGRSGRLRESAGQPSVSMLAWPAKGKLVTLAKGLFAPGREPDSRSGAVTTVTPAIQVAAQIGGYLEPSLSTPRLIRTSAALTCSHTVLTQ